MDQAEVSLPDDRDPVEDGDEQHALGEDPGGHEVEIGQAPGRDRVGAGEDPAEHHEPERGLDRPGEELGRIVAQLAGLELGHHQRLLHEAHARPDRSYRPHVEPHSSRCAVRRTWDVSRYAPRPPLPRSG